MRKVIETSEEYNENGVLLRKVVTETSEEDNPCTYPYCHKMGNQDELEVTVPVKVICTIVAGGEDNAV